jgi:cell wall-associated NlpC family hydrolase
MKTIVGDAAMATRQNQRPLSRCLGVALIIICALAAPWISASPALTAGTASGPGTARPADKMAPDIVDRVISSSKEHLGKPYKFRNEYGRVMDCGGFMSYVWSLHGVTLPPSSRDIAHQVDRVPLDKAEKGDLLFFKGRRKFLHRAGHVSMVIGREGGRIRMIHSCARGVVIDEYPAEYYSERFLFAGRIPGLPRDARASAADSAASGAPVFPGPPPKESISIIGVGDIMLGTNHPSAGYLPPNDGRDLLTSVAPILRDADLTVGNLEGVIMTERGASKTIADPGEAYAFKSPDHYVRHLADAGFDLLSIANNHANDFGESGRKNTVKRLGEASIHFAGLIEHPQTVLTRDGVTYGFCAFAADKAAVNLNDYKTMLTIVAHLNAVADIVIVSVHSGGEGTEHKHITRKNEFFLGEDRGNPYEFARVAIDAGADIVLGHGPHVPRAVDIYRDRFIAYSLGNFATYRRFNLKGSSGLAPILKITVNRQGVFRSARVYSALQKGSGGPSPDPSRAAFKEICALTRRDIPESGLVFGESGEISRTR